MHTELRIGRISDTHTLELPHSGRMYGPRRSVTSRRLRVWHLGHNKGVSKEIFLQNSGQKSQLKNCAATGYIPRKMNTGF